VSYLNTHPEMKICLISPVPPPYGGIAHWTTLMHRFVHRTTTVELLQVDTAPRWRTINDLTITKRIFGGTFQMIRDYIFFLIALQKKPDLIHLTTSGSLAVFRDLVICLTARLWRIPVVYHIRFGRIPEIATTNTFEWRLLAIAMRLTHMVLSITPDTTETIKQYLPQISVEYPPNPIDFSELPDPVEESEDHHIALFLGWVLPTKGVEELVQAWSELCPAGWELLLAGPGELAYQQNLINHYKPTNLRFVGELAHEDAMQLLARSDLFILPSYTEGFPNVILEAMALRKPIIATPVGAIQDMLSNDSGLLVNHKNTGELTEALSLLTQNKVLRCRLGIRAYEKAQQKYSIDVIFSRYDQIWQSLIKRGN
jgi:glycosyltransferase involved in cell wall biosynthesis